MTIPEPVRNPHNLSEWLAWAYWEIRNNYYTGENELANAIRNDAMTKLQRAWELSRGSVA